MKRLLLLPTLMLLVLLVACGGSDNEDDSITDSDDTIDSVPVTKDDESEKGDVPTGVEIKQVNETFIDDQFIKLHVENIEYVEDFYDRPRYIVFLQLENKTDEQIYLQSGRVFMDDFDVSTEATLAEWVDPNTEADGTFYVEVWHPDDVPEKIEDVFSFEVIAGDGEGNEITEGAVEIKF